MRRLLVDEHPERTDVIMETIEGTQGGGGVVGEEVGVGRKQSVATNTEVGWRVRDVGENDGMRSIGVGPDQHQDGGKEGNITYNYNYHYHYYCQHSGGGDGHNVEVGPKCMKRNL